MFSNLKILAGSCFVILLSLFASIQRVQCSTDAGKSESFYFVQISDTHFGASPDNFDKAQKVVDAINKLSEKIEFVILTGDISNGNIENPTVMQRGKQILSGLKYPLHCVPGNADIYGSPENLTLRTAKYREYFGEPCQKFKAHEVNFISLDLERYRREIQISHPELWDEKNREVIKAKNWQFDTAASSKRLAQIDELFRSMRGEPVIIFQHIPPLSIKGPGDFFPDWPTELEDLWKKYIKENNVQAILTGHPCKRTAMVG